MSKLLALRAFQSLSTNFVMSRFIFTLTCALIASLVTPAAADEPAVLPAEGAWARHHVVNKTDGGGEKTGKTTLKFLGRVMVKGEPCRWIEIAGQTTEPLATYAGKFLVPEKALLESERPIEQAARYIIKQEDKVQLVDADLAALNGVVHLLFLPSVLKGSKVIDEEVVVDYQHGKLTILKGHQGEYVLTRKSNRFVFEYRVWLHKDVPVGFAHAKIKLRLFSGDTLRATFDSEYFLEDTGKDAKSVVSPEDTGSP